MTSPNNTDVETSRAVRSGCRCDGTASSGVFLSADALSAWGDRNSKLLGVLFLVFVVGLTALLMWHSSVRRVAAPRDYNTLPRELVFGGQTFPGEHFRGLEATRKTRDAELTKEIAEVVKSGGAPAFIFGNTVPPQRNIAESLKSLFADYLPSSDGNNALITQLRERISADDFVFEFVLIDGESGIYPDPDIPECLRLFADVSEFHIAQTFQSGDIAEAMYAITATLKVCSLASQVENLVLRDEVATIRERSLRILETVLASPRATPAEFVTAQQHLRDTLTTFPNDVRLWIGDRATGMRVYELARRLGLEAALEPNELDELDELGNATEKGGGGVASCERQLYRTIDADEVLYLRMMREVIDLAKLPYPDRVARIHQIEAEVQSRWETNREGLIAHFLLRDIDRAMLAFSRDRALVETALAAVSNKLPKKH